MEKRNVLRRSQTQGEEHMKLYEVPNNTQIVLSDGVKLKFHHVDGMYSYCTDSEGNVYHVSASEEVSIEEIK